MEWILKNHDWTKVGIMYFADDDNTYDLKLFEEIRKTQKVSMFPVGFVGSTGISSPIVKNGTASSIYRVHFLKSITGSPI